ncbi:MAG: 50S ribosomal protein L19 [Patescibacteria group bacterium]|mgnify:CR=1 FL=1
MANNIDNIRTGDTVKVYQKIPVFIDIKVKGKASKDKASAKKESVKIQSFEGIVIARKHGREAGATITVRRVMSGVGVEKIFPLTSPNIEKIEIIKSAKVRRAKLYYLRDVSGKRARLKRKSLANNVPSEEETTEEPAAEETIIETTAENSEEKAV